MRTNKSFLDQQAVTEGLFILDATKSNNMKFEGSLF